MKVRELLQIEIWSKKTTRKILIVSGIVLGIAAVGLGVLYEVNLRWLTTRERNAAKVALAEIDGLQDFAPLSDQDFDTKDKQAKAEVEAATNAAVTQRDDWLAFQLDIFLSETEGDRDEVRMAVIMWERHLPAKNATTDFGKKMNLSGTELRSLTRAELHKLLD
jgi:hypothetical protein